MELLRKWNSRMLIEGNSLHNQHLRLDGATQQTVMKNS